MGLDIIPQCELPATQEQHHFMEFDIDPQSKCFLCSRKGHLQGVCAGCAGQYEREQDAMVYIGFLCRELVGAYLLADMWGEIMGRIVD
jgi:hypothetical protein